MKTRWFKLGQIVRPHGVKGAVKINVFSDNLERFSNLKHLNIGTDGQHIKYSTDYVQIANKHVIIKFSEVDSVEEAEKLRSKYVFVQRNVQETLPDDTYFVCDLVGMEVYTEFGLLGILKDVISTGSNDVYIVDGDNKEYFIPAIADVIKEVNMQDNKMFIVPLEGLLEL